MHIHRQTWKLIIVFPMIFIKRAISKRNLTTQLYFHSRTVKFLAYSYEKRFRVFWKLYILKKAYILDSILSKTISLKLFSVMYFKEAKRRSKKWKNFHLLSIVSAVCNKTHTTHHPVLLRKSKKIKKNKSFS